MSGNTAYPKPPRIIVQGGAGSGKSTVISTLVQCMEKIFRKEGDNPEHPYILVCAPTGTAAAVIHDQTLHHSFSFNLGIEYMSLSDKARDLKRGLLQNLKVVIIDENLSTLVQMMAWCLMAPSRYLNQCWLIIRVFTRRQFHRNYWRCLSLIWVWKLPF